MIDYDEEDDYKVYSFYLDNNLYAWTTDKKRRDLFLEERGKALKMRKDVMVPIIFRSFAYKYKEREIIDIPLEQDGVSFMIHGTYWEDKYLEEEAENLLRDCEELRYFFNHLPDDMVPSKYLEPAKYIANEYYNYQKENSCGFDGRTAVFNVNSVTLFYQLFQNTF